MRCIVAIWVVFSLRRDMVADTDAMQNSTGAPHEAVGPSRFEVRGHCSEMGSKGAWQIAKRVMPSPVETQYFQAVSMKRPETLLFAETRVFKDTRESRELMRYFYRYMPKGVELQDITRVENPEVWNMYKANRRKVARPIISSSAHACTVEQWLWYGLQKHELPLLLRGGFRPDPRIEGGARGRMFNPDPRLAHVYSRRGMNATANDISIMVLARVAVGTPYTWEHACGQDSETCRKIMTTTDRRARDNYGDSPYASLTSHDRTEIITFDDNAAYPSYIFAYTAPSLSDIDPYRNAEAERLPKRAVATIAETDHVDPFCRCASSYKPRIPPPPRTRPDSPEIPPLPAFPPPPPPRMPAPPGGWEVPGNGQGGLYSAYTGHI